MTVNNRYMQIQLTGTMLVTQTGVDVGSIWLDLDKGPTATL